MENTNLMETYLEKKYILTNRELDILKLVINGYTNNEIAKHLNISSHTVKSYISSLLNKFVVKTRGALAVEVVKELLKNNIDI